MATMTSEQISEIVWTEIWKTQGRAPSADDVSYWVGQGKFQECLDRGDEINDPDYAVKRLDGWQSSGSDVPPYGPYAVPPSAFYGPVPAYPGAQPSAPSGAQDAPGQPIPLPDGVDYAKIQEIVSQAVQEALKGIPAVPPVQFPPYSTTVFGVKVVLHPGE